MAAEESIATIRRAVDAANKRDFVTLQSLTGPGFRRYDLAGALPNTSGSSGAADVIRLLVRAMPDLIIEIKQIFASDDRVAVHLAFGGTHQGELLGIPGSGKRIAFNGVNIYQVIDGKMAETWQLFDIWGLMRQLGKA